MSHNVHVNEQPIEPSMETNPHAYFEDLVGILGESAAYINIATCTVNLLQMMDIEEEQWQPNPLVQMNIPGMLRDRIAVALSGDFDTAYDYATAVFNSNGSVTFLFNTSESARQVARHLRVDWDGLNAVTLNEYDEAVLATAADLPGAEYCCVGQACIVERHIPTLSELAHRYGLSD